MPSIAFHADGLVTRQGLRADGASGPSYAEASPAAWAQLVERASALPLDDAPHDHAALAVFPPDVSPVAAAPMLHVERAGGRRTSDVGRRTSAAWVDLPGEVDAFVSYVVWLDEQLTWAPGHRPTASHDDTVVSVEVFSDHPSRPVETIEVQRDGAASRVVRPRGDDGVEGGVFRSAVDPSVAARLCDDVESVASLAQDGHFDGASSTWGLTKVAVRRADRRRHDVLFGSEPPDGVEPIVTRIRDLASSLDWTPVDG